MYRCYAIDREFKPRDNFLYFLFTSFCKSFFIVGLLLPLIQVNVNFRDYLYMLTMRHIGRYDFSDLLLVTACVYGTAVFYYRVFGANFWYVSWD